MKAYDVEVNRKVRETIPVWADTPQQAEAEVVNTVDDAEVVGVTLNEFWTEAFSATFPPYDSEGCYLERE